MYSKAKYQVKFVRSLNLEILQVYKKITLSIYTDYTGVHDNVN